MSSRTQPPFRSDHVGSFLRPQSLLDMREKNNNNDGVTAKELRAHEDECIANLVRFEEALGLQSITDGEFRRGGFHSDFLNAIHNLEFKPTIPAEQATAKGQGTPVVAVVEGKVNRPEGGIEVENFKYLQSLTDRLAKQTSPSPTMAHFRGGREASDKKAYPDLEEFFQDLARVYREEIEDLAQVGCKYLQLDDTNLAYTVEICTDLVIGSWDDAGVTSGTNLQGGGTFYDIVTNNITTIIPQSYIRLKITE